MIIQQNELSPVSGTRLLGFDIGEKTLGLAISDTLWTIATPFTTLRRIYPIQKDVDAILAIVKQEKVHAFVMGYPLNMNGTEGPSCKRVMDLCACFESIPVILWDERLSTVAVQRAMIDSDLSRQKRSKHVDKLAAAYILQGFLDRLYHKR